MNKKVDKESFYELLEGVLNENYDGNFKFKTLEKDLSDYSSSIGTKYIYFIETEDKTRLFESYSAVVHKQKIGNSYVTRNYDYGKTLNINNINDLLSSHLLDYQALEIIPDSLKIVLGKYNDEDICCLDEKEKEVIVEISKEYKGELEKIKQKVRMHTLTSLRKKKTKICS